MLPPQQITDAHSWPRYIGVPTQGKMLQDLFDTSKQWVEGPTSGG